jgi:uncharacterized repeat protein (TIGR03943 family)
MGALSALILVFFFSGQLSFFIHPRYNLFTVAMTAVAILFALLSVVMSSRVRRISTSLKNEGTSALPVTLHDHSDPDHDHDHDVEVPTTRLGVTTAVVSAVLSVAAVVTLVVLPPATLSTVTVENRAINQAALGDTEAAFAGAQSGDAETFLAFTVREWAGILRQTQDPTFFQGKPVDVVGFVVADRENPGTFFVTRFVVSCCSVDAQPVGIPVYEPGFEQSFPDETWVRVVGEFVVNPDTSSSHPLVVRPRELGPTEQPREPYLF